MDWIWFGIISTILGYFLYKWGTKNNDYFEKIGIPYAKPVFLVGSTGSIFWKRQSLLVWLNEKYKLFPNEKIFGLFDFLTPLYFIRDPEIAKHLAIKEFDHFEDHKNVLDEELDPLLGNALTALTGQKWRNMRSALSPAFTGSKMRQMHELVTECSENLATHLLKENKENVTAGKQQIIEVKELFSRFTNDVIATSAFGIKVNSLKDKDNEFFKMGRTIMNFSKGAMMFRFFVIRCLPWVAKKFNVKMVNDKITKFFSYLILDTIKVREQQNIIRPDMINLIMQIKSGDLKHNKSNDDNTGDSYAAVTESEATSAAAATTVATRPIWSDNQLIAQCLLFFLAGFDTSSTLLTFLAYELAINLDVQMKLINEIDTINETLRDKQKLTYENLQSMKYLDMVVSETLRKWPPAGVTDRLCTKDYLYENGDIKVKIEKGLVIWIPISAYHNDPKYFPNPSKFDPERFSADNVGNIQPGSYIPFGIGPRNCIGSRFALMEIKSVIFHLLQDFTINPCDETVIPIDSVIGPLSPLPMKGVHLELIARHK